MTDPPETEAEVPDEDTLHEIAAKALQEELQLNQGVKRTLAMGAIESIIKMFAAEDKAVENDYKRYDRVMDGEGGAGSNDDPEEEGMRVLAGGNVTIQQPSPPAPPAPEPKSSLLKSALTIGGSALTGGAIGAGLTAGGLLLGRMLDDREAAPPDPPAPVVEIIEAPASDRDTIGILEPDRGD